MAEMELTPLSWHKTDFHLGIEKTKEMDPFEDIYHYSAGEAIALYLSTRSAELRCDGLTCNEYAFCYVHYFIRFFYALNYS